MAGAGAAGDFRQVPESNGTHVSIVALDIVSSVGVDLTDRLAVGASFVLSSATLDGPFVGITGASSDYGIRGGVGFNYELPVDTTVGLYWKSEVGYTFENLIRFVVRTPFLDVSVDRPEILGLGISNNSSDGWQVVAVDRRCLPKLLRHRFLPSDLCRSMGGAVRAQYSPNCRCRLRAGYAYNENPMRTSFPPAPAAFFRPAALPTFNTFKLNSHSFRSIESPVVSASATCFRVLISICMPAECSRRRSSSRRRSHRWKDIGSASV